MNDHPNKHIRDAVDYAIGNGWRLVKSGPRAHAWGRLYCPAQTRGGCIISVYSTPRVPENHARYIRRRVDACPHQAPDGSEE
jgi:hypothetical protein